MMCKKQFSAALSLLCAATMLCGCNPQEESSVKEAETASSVAEETTTEATTTTTEATTTATEATTTVTTTTTAPSKSDRENPTIAQGLTFGMTVEEMFAVMGEDYFYETDSATLATGEELPTHYYEYELPGISRFGVEMETVLTIEFSEQGYLYNVCYHIGRIPNGTDPEYGWAISDYPYNEEELTDVYYALQSKLTKWFGEGTRKNEYDSYVDEYEWYGTDCGDLWFTVGVDTWGSEGLNQIWLSSADYSWLEKTDPPASGGTGGETSTPTEKNATIVDGIFYGMNADEVIAVMGNRYVHESGTTWATGESMLIDAYHYTFDGIDEFGVDLKTTLTFNVTETGSLYEVCFGIGRIPDGMTDTGSVIWSESCSEDELTDAYYVILDELQARFGDGIHGNDYGYYIDEYSWNDTSCGNLWFMVAVDAWDVEGNSQIWLASSDYSVLE